MQEKIMAKKAAPLTWPRSKPDAIPNRKFPLFLRRIASASLGEWLTHAGRKLDTHLRKKQRIFEFCDHPHCLLRIALHRTQEDLVLTDAIRLGPGELVAELHLWNEHIPRILAAGPNLSWAVLTQRRMRESMALLANHVRSDSRLGQVRVFHARGLFGSGKSQASMKQFAKQFGFEQARTPLPGSLLGRLRNYGECLHHWAMIRAFNPGALAGRRLTDVACHQLWITRVALLTRFPALQPNSSPCPSGAGLIKPPGGT
jgi:hypothetical protein